MPIDIGGHPAAGDGRTDDTEVFRRALGDHGHVYVPDGIYSVSNLPIWDFQKLHGPGILRKLKTAEHTVILAGKESEVDVDFASGGYSQKRGHSEVYISECARNVRIGGRFRGSLYSAITGAGDSTPYAVPTRGVTIRADFTGKYYLPLLLADIEHVRITHSWFEGMLGEAVKLLRNVKHFDISHNTFIHDLSSIPTTDKTSRDGVDLAWGGTDGTICDNTIIGSHVGIDCKGDGIRNIIMARNRIYGTRHSAIVMNSAPPSTGAPIRNIVAEGNIMEGCGTIASADRNIWVKGGVESTRIVNNRGTVSVTGKNGTIVVEGNA